MSHILEASTRQGQLVLDPFMGSASTGVAAIQTGRRFIGIDSDPKWFDLARRRLEQTHRQPRLFEEPRPKAVQLDLIGGGA